MKISKYIFTGTLAQTDTTALYYNYGTTETIYIGKFEYTRNISKVIIASNRNTLSGNLIS